MNGTLPTWMEHWLGLADKPGMGIAWRLEFHWPLPAWASLLLVAGLALAIVGIYVRENRRTSRAYRFALAAMRLALIGLVLLMASQVELALHRTGLPYVIVIVDDTRSMNTVDRYDEAWQKSFAPRVARAMGLAADGDARAPQLSRWNLARTLLAEDDGALVRALAEDHKLRFYFLSRMKESRGGGDAAAIVGELAAAEPGGDSTQLGAAVRSAIDELRGTTPAAVVLATDGINTDGPGLPEAAAYARRKGVPLYFIGIGSDRLARDLRLSNLEVEDVVFVDDLVQFRFKLTASGFEGKTVGIVLRCEAQPGSGAEPKRETVGRIEVTAGGDGRPQQVVLPHRPARPGLFRYTIDVEPPQGGLSAAHPPLARTLRVREEKIRVLLVEGSPRFEYRFLHNLLGRDKTIELRTLLQEADHEFNEADKSRFLHGFPVKREDLLAYDVVIFGDVNPALLSSEALKNLEEFVDRPDKGGAIVFIAGPSFMPQAYRNTPLARLLPFDPVNARSPDPNVPLDEGFTAQPTEIGLVSPALQLDDSLEQSQAAWRKLPPLYWMTEISELKPAARVLLEHPGRGGDGRRWPLAVMQYVGGGKVFFQATDETYRWRRRVGDLYFARYWIQTLRFLSRSKLAEGDRSARLSTDRRDYRPGDAVRIEAHFTDERLAPTDDQGVTVELEQVGRQTQKVQLRRTEAGRGHFEAVLNHLPVGDYRAKLIAPAVPGEVPAAEFVIPPPQTELIQVQMDAAEMRAAAELTQGHYYAYKDAGRLIEDLPGGRQVPIENLPAVPLWNRWPMLLLFLVLLIGEWLLRKRGGMV